MAITYLLWALAFLGLAQSHMIMNTPTPYNLHGTTDLVQVNPLGLSDTISTTTLTAGASQIVKFTGGAQHGGGSCQFSVTYDFPPPADKSKWKTIYTLIGGCPVSAEGNLPVTGADQDGRADAAHCGNDSGTECIREFNVPIPKGLPNGNATFAWTWFNKIGNREVYMNCAPVSITGGSADDAEGQAFLKELPSLFLANVPGECITGNGVLNIPNPGKYGRVLEQPAPGSEGNCPKAAVIPVFEGGSGGGSGSASSAVVSSAGPVSTTTPPSASVQPIPTSPTSFGLCANGLAIPQAVAPGTVCTDGKIVRRGAKFFW
ncbi:hypothetical protein NEMBOFW57_008072 [Staphylotrichum longicolle]|uniref:Lytic polysaccharide monooxygenase n=1 Tax=Staphylotrichum longicolle TaxID=669026 RepID=A0AAD4EQP8_9PEZI|nr:hypothetical protein NEMBOFW57_008072 [Staphylotrichum longicolle]